MSQRYLRAVAVSQCSNPRFTEFANIDIDAPEPDRDARVRDAIEIQLYGRRVNFNAETLADIVGGLLGNPSVETLLRMCSIRTIDRVEEPDPPETIDPGPDVPNTPGHEGGYNIAIINRSSASNAEINRWHHAWAWQLEEHYSPWYGDTTISIGQRSDGDFLHEIHDQADGPYGGYHTTDSNTGLPIARTFLSSGQPSVVGSHENVELFNAWVVYWALITLRKLWWGELADPVQRITYPAPNGELVSDFVLPAWFGAWLERDPKALHAAALYANTPVLNRYRQIAPGGYMGELSTATGALDFIYASGAGLEGFGTAGIGCQIRHKGIIERLRQVDSRIHIATHLETLQHG